GETEAQKAFRHELLDELAVQIKSLINDGGTLALSLDLDRKKHDLSLGLRLTPKPGTDLAKDIAALGGAKSVGASLVGKASAMHATVRLAMPAKLRKTFGPVIEEVATKAVAAEKDKEKAALLKELLDALKPTAKAGVLDAGLDFRGPGKGG